MNGAAAIKDPDGIGDSWGTPMDLWEEIRILHFPAGIEILDPAPNPKRVLPGTIIRPGDGLVTRWDRPFFNNPPWSNITPWAKTAAECRQLGVMLIPVRSDQPWFHARRPMPYGARSICSC